MDRAQAYHNFWSGFGWTAYDSYSVPSSELNPAIPRITYDFGAGEFEDEIMLSASLWDISHSWSRVQAKAEEIYEAIGLAGRIIPYDKGKIWIKRGTPFYQRMPDENDSVRRIYLNLEVEFFTSL